jgi:hypothetical protein
MLWEIVLRQPHGHIIPPEYVHYDILKMRWLVNRLPALDENLKRLKARRYISLIEDQSDGIFIRLTRAGMAVLIQHCLARKAKTSFNRKSEVCILSFDIPETRRADRLALGRLLRVAKFKRVHKSTWIGRPQLAEHLMYLLRLHELERYVCVYFGRQKYIQE